MNGRAAKLIRNSVEGNPLARGKKRKYRAFRSQTTGNVTLVNEGPRGEYRMAKKTYRSLDEAGREWFNREARAYQ